MKEHLGWVITGMLVGWIACRVIMGMGWLNQVFQFLGNSQDPTPYIDSVGDLLMGGYRSSRKAIRSMLASLRFWSRWEQNNLLKDTRETPVS